MPKRKLDNDDLKYLDHIKKKMKKLERKWLKRSRKFSSSTESVQLSNDPKADNIEPVNVENNNLSDPGPSDSALHTDSEHYENNPIIPAPEEPPPTAGDFSSKNDVPDVELDEFMLKILGKDPFGKNIEKDLALRYNFIATTSLTKEVRKELLDTHLTPDNCRLISAPSLNPEINAAVTEQVVKRDKAIEAKQKQIRNAIACLSEAITLLLEKY